MSENQGQIPEGAPESEKEGYQERYDLSVARLKEMQAEDTTAEPFRDYFRQMAGFALGLTEITRQIMDGSWHKLSLEELQEGNLALYADILPDHYEVRRGVRADLKLPVYGASRRDRLCLRVQARLSDDPERTADPGLQSF